MEWEQQKQSDPRSCGVTQVHAAWARIVCYPRYSGEYRINCISLLILSIFLATEFASFVAGKIIQVIEAMPGSVVPLAMFF